MRVCDPNSAAAKLDTAMDTLQKARSQALSLWDDDTSRIFDEQFMVALEPKVRRALDAIRHLAESLAKAERDCS
jgi:hypothetical protein